MRYRHLRHLLSVSAFVLLAVLPAAELSAATTIRYVGTGATCDQVTDHPSLAAALFAAAFTAADDEIRLTNTLSYPGISQALTDWDPATNGKLTIAGGYTNCDSAFSDSYMPSVLGDVFSSDIFVVRTSARPVSRVTLRNLLLTAGLRAVRVQDGGQVSLEGVVIDNNVGGVAVESGGSLSMDGDSWIAFHDSQASGVLSTDGGGIHCSGNSSYVGIRGKLDENLASQRGGNLFVGPGCVAELFDGAVIEGPGSAQNGTAAVYGGGIYVDNGVLLGSGSTKRIIVRDHYAHNNGGGLYITGSNAVASLNNVEFSGNSARITGGGVHVANGAQFAMNRVAACNLIFSCSQFSWNRLVGGRAGAALYVDDAYANLTNSVLLFNGVNNNIYGDRSLVEVTNDGLLEVDGLGMVLNNANHLFHASGGGEIRAAYVTSALNSYQSGGLPAKPWNSYADGSPTRYDSSIFVDGKGFQDPNGGTTSASCLLLDTGNGAPSGSFFLGTPTFVNAAGGDIRQTSNSVGVDICQQLSLSWVGTKDIELKTRGQNTLSNPDGYPGILGGTFDAGFHEVDGEFGVIFADGFESGDMTRWSDISP